MLAFFRESRQERAAFYQCERSFQLLYVIGSNKTCLFHKFLLFRLPLCLFLGFLFGNGLGYALCYLFCLSLGFFLGYALCLFSCLALCFFLSNALSLFFCLALSLLFGNALRLFSCLALCLLFGNALRLFLGSALGIALCRCPVLINSFFQSVIRHDRQRMLIVFANIVGIVALHDENLAVK